MKSTVRSLSVRWPPVARSVGWAIALVTAYGCSPGDTEFVEFGSYRSPDDQYSVVITAAPGPLAYAPIHLRIWLGERDERDLTLLMKTKIGNDGVPIGENNVRPEWLSPRTLRLCLSGDEQEDEVVIVDIGSRSAIAERAQCVD